MTLHYVLSVDLGKVSDYTCGVILSVDLPRSQVIRVVEISRSRGRSYVDVVRDIARIKLKLESLSGGSSAGGCTLLVDQSGVGEGITDLMKEEGLDFTGFSITGGRRTRKEGNHWFVPKTDMVMLTASALSQGRVQISKSLVLADTLVRELSEFQMKTTGKGGKKYEAEGSGHDDAVLALSMGVFYILSALAGFTDIPFMSGGGATLPGGLPGAWPNSGRMSESDWKEMGHPSSIKFRGGKIPRLP